MASARGVAAAAAPGQRAPEARTAARAARAARATGWATGSFGRQLTCRAAGPRLAPAAARGAPAPVAKQASRSAPKAPKEEIADEKFPTTRVRWSAARDSMRPTQAALGWDWAISKMVNLRTAADAQEYMDRKPVPYVQRGPLKYVVDHHHTLVTLNESGWDPEITLQEIGQVPEGDRTIEGFWAYMEGRGLAFLRDENYKPVPPSNLPTKFEFRAFRNDVYRSIAGFARNAEVLKRGATLEERLFFEFRWGYFFWLHRENEFGFWPDARLHRAFQRQARLLEAMDSAEYQAAMSRGNSEKERLQTMEDLVFLADEVITPSYTILMFYLRHLCYVYAGLEGRARDVPGLSAMFGFSQLPGKVVHESDDLLLLSEYKIPNGFTPGETRQSAGEKGGNGGGTVHGGGKDHKSKK